jgi:hypothetical protein
MLFTATALAAQSVGTMPTSGIPVDMDTYYKSLDGRAAYSKIQGATKAAASELAAAVRSSGGRAAGVDDVEWLYADGWREFTLRAIGGKAEIWVANDLSYGPGDPRPAHVVTQEQVDYLFAEFNDHIYPGATHYFGLTNDRDGTGGLYASWGYDWYATDDPQRVMILVYNIVDENYDDPEYPFYVAGYFWPDMNDTYADRNIIHIDSYDWANRVGPDAARPYLYEQVFTHEYEHAIHYDHDPDEASWVDEGLADLAPYLVGYGHSSDALAYYTIYHRTPLTVWGGGLEDYGASYLFQLYLLENFGGPDFVKGLVNDSTNGIEGIENQLASQGYGDVTFDDVYRDWTLANYLDDLALPGASGAPLGYEGLDIPSADTWGYSIQWSIKNHYGSDNRGNLPIPRYWGGYNSGTVQYPLGDLMPYAPMYLTYGGFTPKLIANLRAPLTTGVPAHSGSRQLWGGRGDLLFNTATLAAPLTLGSDAALTFWANYQIEDAWDFGFVQISTDGGTTWISLENEDTTIDHDPSAITTAVDNLPGFTGSSGGWVEESFDLSAYAGQSVLLRFLYITDWATTEAGFYVDDIVVTDATETLLQDDLESGSGTWDLDGWQHTTGLAENDWAMTLLNPQYVKGKFEGIEIVDAEIVSDAEYQRSSETLDTSLLNREQVTIVLSNRLPEATSFPAAYRLLVEKGNAKK